MFNIVDFIWRISFYLLPFYFLICILSPRNSNLYRAATVFAVLYILGGIYVFFINALRFGSYNTDISYINQLDGLIRMK